MVHEIFTQDTIKALLTTLIGSIAAILSAMIASKNVSRTIKNQNKGLPPELLRLEKIQSILINHESNPSIRYINISRLKKEYERSIHKSVLESQISHLGIQDDFARQKLLNLPEKIFDYGSFPDLNRTKGHLADSFLKLCGTLLGITAILGATINLLFIIFLLILGNMISDSPAEDIINSTIILIMMIPIIFLSKFITHRWSLADIETDLIVRNVYQYCYEYFTGLKGVVLENESELKKRIVFENSIKFKKWKSKNPESTSWDYGFNPYSKGREDMRERALPKGFSLKDDRLILRRDFPFISKGVKIQKAHDNKNIFNKWSKCLIPKIKNAESDSEKLSQE